MMKLSTNYCLTMQCINPGVFKVKSSVPKYDYNKFLLGFCSYNNHIQLTNTQPQMWTASFWILYVSFWWGKDKVWREVKFKKVPYRKSQNYGRIEVSKGIWRSLGPNSSSVDWATESWLPRTVSRWRLNNSKDGGSTASLNNVCQCSATTSKNTSVPWCSGRISCISVLCLLPQNYDHSSQLFSFWSVERQLS